jgi:hypothetical protein
MRQQALLPQYEEKLKERKSPVKRFLPKVGGGRTEIDEHGLCGRT